MILSTIYKSPVLNNDAGNRKNVSENPGTLSFEHLLREIKFRHI